MRLISSGLALVTCACTAQLGFGTSNPPPTHYRSQAASTAPAATAGPTVHTPVASSTAPSAAPSAAPNAAPNAPPLHTPPPADHGSPRQPAPSAQVSAFLEPGTSVVFENRLYVSVYLDGVDPDAASIARLTGPGLTAPATFRLRPRHDRVLTRPECRDTPRHREPECKVLTSVGCDGRNLDGNRPPSGIRMDKSCAFELPPTASPGTYRIELVHRDRAAASFPIELVRMPTTSGTSTLAVDPGRLANTALMTGPGVEFWDRASLEKPVRAVMFVWIKDGRVEKFDQEWRTGYALWEDGGPLDTVIPVQSWSSNLTLMNGRTAHDRFENFADQLLTPQARAPWRLVVIGDGSTVLGKFAPGRVVDPFGMPVITLDPVDDIPKPALQAALKLAKERYDDAAGQARRPIDNFGVTFPEPWVCAIASDATARKTFDEYIGERRRGSAWEGISMDHEHKAKQKYLTDEERREHRRSARDFQSGAGAMAGRSRDARGRFEAIARKYARGCVTKLIAGAS